MIKLARRCWIMAFLVLYALPLSVRAAPANACSYLAHLVDQAPSGPVFLTSYPTAEPGPLAGTAFLYDNAAAVIALVGCDDRSRADRIGQAILIALDNDRFWHDGRLRNAYAAGAAGHKPVKLAGWWDKAQNRWLEDRYQVGSDSGNMAWAMLALLALDHTEAAAKIGDWVAREQDRRGMNPRRTSGHGNRPSTIPTSRPPSRCSVREQATRSGAILRRMRGISSVRCGTLIVPASPPAPPKTASHPIRPYRSTRRSGR
jgi:hypothetical protein